MTNFVRRLFGDYWFQRPAVIEPSVRISEFQKFKMVIFDGDAIVLNEDMHCCDTAEELFNVLNSRCDFAKWTEADAYVQTGGEPDWYSWIFDSEDPRQNRASTIRALHGLLVQVGSLTTRSLTGWRSPIAVQIRVLKHTEDANETDGPAGPIYGVHPGFDGGWGPGWYEEQEHRPGAADDIPPPGPHGSDKLARMRGVLQQV